MKNRIKDQNDGTLSSNDERGNYPSNSYEDLSRDTDRSGADSALGEGVPSTSQGLTYGGKKRRRGRGIILTEEEINTNKMKRREDSRRQRLEDKLLHEKLEKALAMEEKRKEQLLKLKKRMEKEKEDLKKKKE